MKARDARVLLTGASGGIGRVVAAALADAGARVMLAGRDPARLAAQTQELRTRAGEDRAVWREVDLESPARIAALALAAQEWGCNVVVHNAGMARFGRLADDTLEHSARVLGTNLVAPVLLTQALLPHLLAQPAAQVICMGSVLGRLGLPGYSVYGASKFGLRGFAEALRRELLDTAVAVKYLGPRSTRTAFNSPEAVAYNEATDMRSDPPEAVARALLGLLEGRGAERFLGFPEKLAVRLNGLAPTLLDGAFAKHRAHLG